MMKMIPLKYLSFNLNKFVNVWIMINSSVIVSRSIFCYNFMTIFNHILKIKHNLLRTIRRVDWNNKQMNNFITIFNHILKIKHNLSHTITKLIKIYKQMNNFVFNVRI